jgi:hypothetical protein
VSEFRPEHFTLGRATARAPRTAATWSVFSTEGRWVADVQLPARFSPFDFGSDYVAGVLFDDDDTEQVVVFGIRKE